MKLSSVDQHPVKVENYSSHHVLSCSLLFYLRQQQQGSRWLRFVLGAMRGLLLALLVVTLADPVLQLDVVNRLRPLVYVVIDGTESMAIDDELSPAERTAIDKATSGDQATSGEKRTRIQYVQSLLTSTRNNLLARLRSENGTDVEAFIFDGNTTSQLRRLRAFR
jgi:hypothetical protein